MSRRIRSRKITEEDLDHPFIGLLAAPNPLQDAPQLIQTTVIGIVGGEIFWSFVDSEGRPIAPRDGMSAEAGDEIWPVPSACVKPIFIPASGGIFSGWEVVPPKWHPWSAIKRKRGRGLPLRPEQLMQFKLSGPEDIVRGFSPHNAAAGAIESYAQIRKSNRALLKNDSTPRGIVHTSEGIDPDQKAELEEEWEKEYGGEGNYGKTAFLSKAKYERIGLSPREMDYAKLLDVDRREMLAAVRTPESSLGITEGTNYANQIGQDYGFLTRTVQPIAHLIECAIDKGFFGGSGDDIFPAFDMSEVDALRAGLVDKVRDANALAGTALHVPPRQAFEVVGLDVPGYEGDDVAFVGSGLITAEDIAAGLSGLLAPPTAPPGDGAAPDDSDGALEGELESEGETPLEEIAQSRSAPAAHLHATKGKKRARQRAFVLISDIVEKKLARGYRKWVRESRTETLERFDAEAAKIQQARRNIEAQAFTAADLAPQFEALAKSLRIAARPALSDALDLIFTFTGEDIGLVTFDITADAFTNVFAGYEQRLLRETPSALSAGLRKTLTEGFSAGETVQELRKRIGQVYSTAASSHKTLLVARTTSGGVLNGVRHAMFEASELEDFEWSSAADEETRTDHLLFDELGVQPLGTNYQDFAEITPGGILLHPGDFNAPFGQIANCRCTLLPV